MDKFADTFGNMQLASQVVRIDLMTVEPGQGDAAEGARRLQRDGQLILPLEGFVRSYAVMGQMIQRLAQAGILKLTPGAGTPEVSGAGAPAGSPAAESKAAPAPASNGAKPAPAKVSAKPTREGKAS